MSTANPSGMQLYQPANGEPLHFLSYTSQQTIEQTIHAAKDAWLTWSQSSTPSRAKLLFAFRELMLKDKAHLAKLVSNEHGKTLAESNASIDRGIEVVELACNMPYLMRGSYSHQVATDVACYTLRQPLGVCVGITPFNFPVMIPLWQMIPAITCGNTFILKPSPQAPSAPNRLLELLLDAGFPSKVVQIVHGEKAVVDQLITHPEVCAVTAVASTPVAQSVYQTAIAHGKRAHCFGGAKNHAVVLPDCAMEQTANAITEAALGCAGERCMALSVAIVVGDKTAEQFIPLLKSKVSEFPVAPLVSKAHLERVARLVDEGVADGAELVHDGRQQYNQALQGNYFGPCLFDKVTPAMSIYQQEIFGPVLSIVRVKTFEQAIRLINQNPYGNGTALFTENGASADQFVSQIQVGMVGINTPIPVPVAYHSFGGWKQSFFGDIGMHGDQSVQFYTRLKTVTRRWQND